MSNELKYAGLTADEVSQSRARYGVNVLTPAAKDPMWKLFLMKFRDPLI
ncbi:MAG: hypothetical protein K2M68_01465, partial [Muribaculaceae bacterium]|nr:hypothetical protein [Muribaculaceae bacterium]